MIDVDSLFIWFCVCFDILLSMGIMIDMFWFYDDVELLNVLGWFDCFDVVVIVVELNSGDVFVFEGVFNMLYGFDIVVVVN